MKERKSIIPVPVLFIILICVLLNFVAWKSAAFSDFYVKNIFPAITLLYGRLTSVFPFSVGEIMLVFIVLSGCFQYILCLSIFLT